MICDLVFSGHPLGKSIIGTPESLAGIDREALTGYLQNEYTRDSIVIAIAGNFDEKDVEMSDEDIAEERAKIAAENERIAKGEA